jgi:exonuclease SbcD
MKILHTADWHLGKNLGNFPLIELQKQVLEQLIDYCQSEKPDVLLLSGDVYDRNVPPAEAVSLFGKTITQIVDELKITVMAIAGNHDSAERIQYGAELFAKNRFYVAGMPTFPIQPIVLEDEFGEVDFYLFPYCEPQNFQFILQKYAEANPTLNFIPTEDIETHQQVFEILCQQISKTRRSVLVAHAFVSGGTSCDSERKISVGGSEMVSKDVFNPFLYVALGHLHQRQIHQNCHYSGSLLKYSVSEVHHHKSFTLVEIGQNSVSTKFLPIVPPQDLVLCEAVLMPEEIKFLDKIPNTNDFIYMRLNNPVPIPNAMAWIQKSYPFTVGLEWLTLESKTDLTSLNAKEMRNLDEMGLVSRFYRDMVEENLTPHQLKTLSEIIAELKA